MQTGHATRPPRRIPFLLGCIVLILTAAAHTAAHLKGPETPASEDQAQMLRLMQSVQLDIFSVKRTMMQITSGFSWHFSASLALIGAMGIALWWCRRGDRGMMRLVAAFYAVFLIVMTAMSAALFPPPPTAFFAVAALLFATAAAAA